MNSQTNFIMRTGRFMFQNVMNSRSVVFKPTRGLRTRSRLSERFTEAQSNLKLVKDQGNDVRVSVKKMLMRSATYEETPSTDPVTGGDPFISGPYASGTKVPEELRQEHKEQMEVEEIPKIDPRTRTVITFPGDGCQYIGMCGDHTRMPKHIEVLYDIASGTLGLDLLDLCANGPLEKLNQTRYSQPAIFIASLAALEKLRDMDPYAIEYCAATAGFGVGEIAALVFAGCLNFEDAVHLVKVRSEAMQLASEMTPGGLALVLYGADSKLGDAMNYAKEWCRREHHIEYPVCSIANYLFPHCKIIGGNREALDFIKINSNDFRLRKVKILSAAAAYHTELMRPAAEPIKAFLRNISIKQPRVPIHSCYTGGNYLYPKQIQTGLEKQVHSAIRWEQILQNIYSRPQDAEFPSSYECGPGRSLTAVLEKVNRKAHVHHKTISL